MFKKLRDRLSGGTWRFPSKKLPPIGEDVLVATFPGYFDVAEFRGGDNERDWWAFGERIQHPVFAWCELPSGPPTWSGGTHKGTMVKILKESL